VRGHGFVGGAHVGNGEALGLQGDVVGGRGDGGEERRGAAAAAHFGVASALGAGDDGVDGGGSYELLVVVFGGLVLLLGCWRVRLVTWFVDLKGFDGCDGFIVVVLDCGLQGLRRGRRCWGCACDF
jgi:hypothetical protein